MTATQSPLSPSSASERRTDPSMEEILASIRKIIADDEAPAPRPSPMPAAPRLRDAEEPRPAAVVTPITPGASRPVGHSSFGHSSFGLPRPTLEPFLAAKEPTPARESTADEPVKPEATYGQATEATGRRSLKSRRPPVRHPQILQPEFSRRAGPPVPGPSSREPWFQRRRLTASLRPLRF